jgi:Fe(3+) dicitrate transport protein
MNPALHGKGIYIKGRVVAMDTVVLDFSFSRVDIWYDNHFKKNKSSDTTIYCNKNGDFEFRDTIHKKLSIIAYNSFISRYNYIDNLISEVKIVESNSINEIEIPLKTITNLKKNRILNTVEYSVKKQSDNTRMKSVDGFGIYEGKKSEVIVLDKINANLATNNSRQVFAKVPGMNVIENDGGGIQLGLAVRGLNPNRIAEFNSRQNGYDMAADALGYPESYYTPPLEGVERLEVIRGAASLQYGPQFGGLLNFVMRTPSDTKKVELKSQLTYGSFGLLNIFNSVGGTILNKDSTKKTQYYGFYHHKEGEGWRNRTGFNVNTYYGMVNHSFNKKLDLKAEITYMDYLMMQPGGLTEKQFLDNPRQATRFRNWFHANWMIPSLSMNYQINESNKINIRTFSLLARRESLGNLIAPNRVDDKDYRLLLADKYQNYGAEVRYIKNYDIQLFREGFHSDKQNTLLVGARYYQGNTTRKQGRASGDTSANFTFLNPQSH